MSNATGKKKELRSKNREEENHTEESTILSSKRDGKGEKKRTKNPNVDT